jgi:hypothetical protein
MLFRLINTPTIFQRYIDNIISLYLYDFTITYLDDILIFSNNIEEHIQYIKMVLQKLQITKLQVKLKKYKFYM